jgi:hypothetical protein
MDMGINGLESVVNEMDVQDRYRVALRNVFKDIIFESKYRTDGLAYSEKNNLRMLLEHKHRRNFISMIERAMVVAQVIRYIKTIHDENPKIMPKVAVVGDENECFVLPVKDIINYISIKEYDWSLSPSSMHQDKVLVSDLIDDDVIKELYIYKPQTEFKEIVNKIKEINKGVNVPRTLTEKNIDKVYNFFTDKITVKRLGKKIAPNDSVNLFAHIMLHPDSVMLNSNTKQLFTGMFKEPLSISNINYYNSFINEFSRKYTIKQKHTFTAILDRLIEDTTRRKQGEFFTPTEWVNKAHEYITSVFGEDWKEKYIVWDPAWGTGNLTRDYKFKELYVSTLNQSDIDTTDQMGYNTESTKFQYDFLNDDYNKLPVSLRSAIESGKKIIVLMNPPYQDGSELSTKNGESLIKGNVQTSVNKLMKEHKIGKCSKQLYAQFLYRILMLNNLDNISIACFSPTLYLTGESYEEFQNKFFKKYEFSGGFMFNSSNFSDTADSWPISFITWKNGVQSNKVFNLDVLTQVKKDSEIIKTHQKQIISVLDENRLVKNLKKELEFNGTLIGLCTFQGNTVQGNNQFVTILNGGRKLSGKGAFEIFSSNIFDICTFFSVRRLYSGTNSKWTEYYDDYVKPNKMDEKFRNFETNSIVYSLFENKSNQLSTDVIQNQFFWMSKEEIVNLSNQNNYNELYNDARTDSDRYVYNLLFGEQRIYDQLSDEAKDVLDTASNLVRLSFGMRRNFADDTNHLNSWDAGYAQLKLLWKEYYPEQFKEFRDKYKVLEEKMRPMVYELGFLLK